MLAHDRRLDCGGEIMIQGSRDSSSLIIGTTPFVYAVAFGERKRLVIEVHPDLSIIVRAPLHITLDLVENKVQLKSPWIRQQLRYFSSFLPRTPARLYVSGETHFYLGHRYQLKVLRTRDEESVKLSAGQICIVTRTPNSLATKQELLQSWYRKHALRFLRTRFEECLDHSAFRGAKASFLSIRVMKKRWGSCSPRGRITLNVDLIRASRPCIDYVVTHELCHLVVPSHSAKFDRLLFRVMPDWRNRKSQLERLLS